jgi:small multidrug resistance pump
MQLSDGFSELVPSLIVGFAYGGALISYIYLSVRIELGIIYAIWSGAGTALVATVGVIAFGESLSALKLVGLAPVIAGVFGLNARLPGERRST